jgi:hypothetical protein
MASGSVNSFGIGEIQQRPESDASSYSLFRAANLTRRSGNPIAATRQSCAGDYSAEQTGRMTLPGAALRVLSRSA